MQTDPIIAQLRAYENEEAKLTLLAKSIAQANRRREKLQTATMDPAMLKDCAEEIVVC